MRLQRAEVYTQQPNRAPVISSLSSPFTELDLTRDHDINRARKENCPFGWVRRLFGAAEQPVDMMPRRACPSSSGGLRWEAALAAQTTDKQRLEII